MNWHFTRPGRVVFEQDEPFCFLSPMVYRALEPHPLLYKDLATGRDLRDDEITVLEGWAGELYGLPVDSTMEAMALGAQLEAMITDPVYEGKSLAGLIDLVKEGEIPASSTVLYAHLGGQPAINAYHSLWT